MTIIKIETNENGAHLNQSSSAFLTIPEGWAVILDNLDTPNFPFGEVDVEEIDGVPTVVKWTANDIPEVEPIEHPPTANDILNVLLGVE